MEQRFFNKKLDIPGYVRANDGKYYKYNFEFNNVYYCPDNVIVDNFDINEFMMKFKADYMAGKPSIIDNVYELKMEG